MSTDGSKHSQHCCSTELFVLKDSQALPGLALILYKCHHIPKLGKHKTFKPTGKNEGAVNALAAL